MSLPLVVVTGANGLVGSQVCRDLIDRGARVRAIVRRSGTAPRLRAVEEIVGEFTDPDLAAAALTDAGSAISTVHPMDSDRATQHRIAVEGTSAFAQAAVAAGVNRLVHISTAAVYDRSPQAGDVDESSDYVADDAGDYPVTKRDADRALAAIDGITRVLLRPPAILGPGPTSVWNTLRPRAMREDPAARRAVPDQSWPWVHLRDLSSLAADIAVGHLADASDPDRGPVAGDCTPVNVVTDTDTQRDYLTAVTKALGVEPEWQEGAAWKGHLLADRARSWGWSPVVGLDEALQEIAAGLPRQSGSPLGPR